MADSSLSVSTAVALATLRNAAAGFLWKAGDDSPSMAKFMGWKDWVDEFLLNLQQGEIDPAVRLMTKTVATVDSQALAWSGATETVSFAIPEDEILIGVALTVVTEFASSEGDTDSVTVELGTTGVDPNRAAEAVELMSIASGSVVVWPAGVGLGEVTGAGTWDLLFTAGGGAPDLGHIEAGVLRVAVLTCPIPSS